MHSVPHLIVPRKNLSCLLFVLAAACAAPLAGLQARDDAARIMLKSLGDATIEVTAHSDGGKLVSDTGKGATLDQPTVANEWSTASITFKTSADAEIQVRLSATWNKEDNKWVFIDKVKGEGVEIQNPDLEGESGQAPTGWTFRQAGTGKASQINDAGQAASGTGFAKVSHGCSLIQTVHVPKDKEVTISFQARNAE